MENFFGTEPDVFTPGLVSGAVDTGAGTFTFTHPQTGTIADDLTATYHWSVDLDNFFADGVADGGSAGGLLATPDTPSAGTTTVEATVTGTGSGQALRERGSDADPNETDFHPPVRALVFGFSGLRRWGGDTQAISFAGNPTETAAFFGRPPFFSSSPTGSRILAQGSALGGVKRRIRRLKVCIISTILPLRMKQTYSLPFRLRLFTQGGGR